jgi:hypothetical protein
MYHESSQETALCMWSSRKAQDEPFQTPQKIDRHSNLRRCASGNPEERNQYKHVIANQNF